MSPEARKIALKAAAKVALMSVALFGCSSHPAEGSSTAQSKLGSSSDCPGDDGSCAIEDADHPTDDDVACCQPVVDDAIAAGEKITTDAQLACCRRLIKHANHVIRSPT